MRNYIHTLTIAAAIIVAGAAVGRAAGDGGDPRVIGYEGFLSQGALPVTRDDVAAEFRLYSSRDATDPIWSSGNTTIDVVEGRFAVALGDAGQSPLGNTVWVQSRLFLEVLVEGNRLDGRQEVLVTPFAARAVPGAWFNADDVDLKSGGTLRAAGRLHIDSEESTYLLARGRTYVSKAWGGSGGLDVDGSLNVGTVDNAGVLNVYGENHAYMQWFPDRGARRGWIGYGGAGTQNMSVTSEAGDLDLTGTRVNLHGQSTTVSGDLSATNNAHGGCEWTGWVDSGADGGDSYPAYCRAGWYVAGIQLKNSPNTNLSVDMVNLLCCGL